MYVHTSFGTYSDRRVLDLQRCAGVIALCCAVLCCAGLGCAVLCSRFWYSTTMYSCILLLNCCCCIPVRHKKKSLNKNGNVSSTLLHKMLEDMLALANSVRLLALSSGTYERECTAKHGTTGHSKAQQGTAQHRTAKHNTAQHRTALRCAVEHAKLGGAGVLFSCFQLAGCYLRKTKKKKRLSPHLPKAVRCTHVLP